MAILLLWIDLIGHSEMEAIHCEALEEHHAQMLPPTILWAPFTGVRAHVCHLHQIRNPANTRDYSLDNLSVNAVGSSCMGTICWKDGVCMLPIRPDAQREYIKASTIDK